MRYCIYESSRNNARCVVEGQCAACAAYQRGAFPPHFLPPAIRLTVSYVPGDKFDPSMWMLLASWNIDDEPKIERVWIED